ncbi:MAG TPA: serine hydrolase domain-containing protein [Candidatus Acidoferrales bacterium]|nr:serine hydrolase domain-containing protein [Candidatus Acidoferrales bacterium]
MKRLFHSAFAAGASQNGRSSPRSQENFRGAPNASGVALPTRKAVFALAMLAPALLLLPLFAPPLTARSANAAPRTSAAAQQKHTGPAPKLPKVKRSEKKAASASPAASEEALQEAPAQLTPQDLSAFFDGLAPLSIERDDIAGMVVAVVKDGKVIFARGYGYSNLKKKTPVSPATTLFRVGSVSKLFTWTAVMQLVQEGKINLDADVNQYLDFRIPETFGKPVTMRDLMTHTPGFEEAIKDLITFNAAKIPSLGDYLKTHLPKEIFPPGTMGAYSNYGATLAGYIVQRVSGEPFDEYIERHIFEPLGMTHATFRQPLPPSLAPDMSQGFQVASGGAKPFEIVTAAPAGALSISALDITHFMIAHLENGSYNGAQILSPATVQEMHTRQYAPDPRVNGMCLGFYEETRNGHRIIGHGGDTIYFHSDLHLILDANTGLFVSYNSLGRGGVLPRGPLFDHFMDRYFPYTPKIGSVPEAEASADARAVSGSYISSRRPQTNIFYMFALLGETSVSPGKDGTLSVAGMNGVNGQPISWHEESHNVWYDPANPQNKIVFKKGANGRLEIALEYPFEVYQQVSWYRSKGFITFMLVVALGIFVLTLILWPIAALVRWHYGHKWEVSDLERRARRWARIVCAIDLVFWAAFIITILEAGSHLNLLSSSADPWFRIIQIIGWLGVFGTLLALWNFWVSVGAPGRWWWAKTHDTLIALACLVSVWLVWFTHLLHFSLNY